ncbi:MAG: class I SAM-dependent methyltransferase [Myxococcales bacterium]|nr:class I SAM-dependent methyltransferase [Myxococcota bacterium]MDW8280671.1 class I SAM-dependent methyltransferase [Myxococcales bacterium]
MELYEQLLRAGSREHYLDPLLYDHEYRRRRRDINYYRRLARQIGTPARVLELGCGSGRVLVPLLRDGHEVVGVDLSLPMLRRCKERIARLGPARRARAHLIHADFRDLPLSMEGKARFPLIICPFNALMHLYTHQDLERFLGGVRARLAPQGLLALDVLMPDLSWLGRDPARRYGRTRLRHPLSGERLIYSYSVSYDPVTQVAFMRLHYDPEDAPGGEAEQGSGRGGWVVHLAHRQFFPQELRALLHYHGFYVERHDGGFDGEPLSDASTEQVICARVC